MCPFWKWNNFRLARYDVGGTATHINKKSIPFSVWYVQAAEGTIFLGKIPLSVPVKVNILGFGSKKVNSNSDCLRYNAFPWYCHLSLQSVSFNRQLRWSWPTHPNWSKNIDSYVMDTRKVNISSFAECRKVYKRIKQAYNSSVRITVSVVWTGTILFCSCLSVKKQKVSK